MNIMRRQIENLFVIPEETMWQGLWFSGEEYEGEHKRWHSKDQLYVHCFYKKRILDGVKKVWRDNGELKIHKLYKDGKLIKDYLA